MKDKDLEEITLVDHPMVLYVVGADADGPVKIGVTTKLPERITGLQGGSWAPLLIWAFRGALKLEGGASYVRRLSAFSSGARALEAATHAKLSDMGFRLMGEWFDVTVEEALEVVQKIGQQQDCRVFSLDDLAEVDASL